MCVLPPGALEAQAPSQGSGAALPEAGRWGLGSWGGQGITKGTWLREMGACGNKGPEGGLRGNLDGVPFVGKSLP